MLGALSVYNTGHQTARAVNPSANLSERREITGIKDEVARVSSSPCRENVAHTGTRPASRTERRQKFKL